jgi:hypothetical protein
MAFEADCGSSTVLDAPRVPSTVGPFVPGECRAVLEPPVGVPKACSPEVPGILSRYRLSGTQARTRCAGGHPSPRPKKILTH